MLLRVESSLRRRGGNWSKWRWKQQTLDPEFSPFTTQPQISSLLTTLKELTSSFPVIKGEDIREASLETLAIGHAKNVDQHHYLVRGWSSDGPTTRLVNNRCHTCNCTNSGVFSVSLIVCVCLCVCACVCVCARARSIHKYKRSAKASWLFIAKRNGQKLLKTCKQLLVWCRTPTYQHWELPCHDCSHACLGQEMLINRQLLRLS